MGSPRLFSIQHDCLQIVKLMLIASIGHASPRSNAAVYAHKPERNWHMCQINQCIHTNTFLSVLFQTEARLFPDCQSFFVQLKTIHRLPLTMGIDTKLLMTIMGVTQSMNTILNLLGIQSGQRSVVLLCLRRCIPQRIFYPQIENFNNRTIILIT